MTASLPLKHLAALLSVILLVPPTAVLILPILVPLTVVVSILTVIIGGNPLTWAPGLLLDLPTRTLNFLGTIGPRLFDKSPPHPSYVHDGEFPTVENVPWKDRNEFFICRLVVYFKKMFTSLFQATYLALFDYEAKKISDGEMGKYWTESSYNSHLKRVPNNKLPAFFYQAGFTPSTDPKISYCVADLSFVNEVKTCDGMHSAGTVSIWQVFEKNKQGKKEEDPFKPRKDNEWPEIRPICIEITHKDGHKVVVKPDDPAWDGAKLFVMQGATHLSMLTDHPKIHFPYDTVNAYSLRLPESHVLRKLLTPHLRFTLALNDTVLNNYFLSIVINPWMSQSPFDSEPPQIRKYLQQCKDTFRFDVNPFPAEIIQTTPYCILMKRYFYLTHQFVSEVVNNRPDEFRDQDVKQWASDIASIVPGFPDGEEIIQDDVIVDAVAKIIWNLSFYHTFDHYSYFCIPWDKNPWRVRVPPPKNATDKVDFSKVWKRVDIWKLAQAEKVFIFTGSSHSMKDIDYQFQDRTLQTLNTWFIQEMKKIDKIQDQAQQLMPLAMMGQSIDF